MSHSFILDGPHTLEQLLQRHLDRLGRTRLRAIQTTVADDHIVLSGRVGSYYHKQLAQEVVRPHSDGRQIRNELQVAY